MRAGHLFNGGPPVEGRRCDSTPARPGPHRMHATMSTDVPADASHWPPPFLLYLGNAPDDLAAKTARGLVQFRPEWCVGQFRGPECRTSVHVPDMDFAQARAAGANTMIVGVANAGGRLGAEAVADIVAALDAGMNVASGLHERLVSHPEIVEAARRNGRHLFDAR